MFPKHVSLLALMHGLSNQVLQVAMPDFLGIGAHRSGTSWLWENLVKHPDIWTPRTKERHFFDRRLDNRYLHFVPHELEGRVRYASLFLIGKLLGKVTGEFTPAYAILPKDKIGLIKAWMPGLRIFFIMRDPVLRAWSHAKKDFAAFAEKPLEEAYEDELIAFFERPAVAKRGDYFTCLKKWTEFYNLDQFYICFTEDIATKPITVLKGAFRFLGLSPDVELDWDKARKPVHVGPSIPIPERITSYLVSSLYKQNDRLESLIGRNVPWG
jgi:hypothetical protein